MGEVFLAWDQKEHRLVALKSVNPELADDPQAIQALHKEGHLLHSLRHRNLVPLLDRGEESFGPYLVLRHIRGASVDEWLRDQGPIPYRSWLKIGAGLISVLAYLHSHEILHCDIKPQNVLLDRRGQPKLTDFGIALTESSESTEGSDFIWGTPYYLAPERLLGVPPDVSSEIYALGATLYHALLGSPPHDAETTEGLIDLLRTAPEPSWPDHAIARDIPPPTRDLILQMLSPDPSARPTDFARLTRDWRRLPRHTPRMKTRIRRVAILIGVLALCGLALAEFTRRSNPTRPGRPGASTEEAAPPSEPLVEPPQGSTATANEATPAPEPDPWREGADLLQSEHWSAAITAWKPILQTPPPEIPPADFHLAILWSRLINQLRQDPSTETIQVPDPALSEDSALPPEAARLFHDLLKALTAPVSNSTHPSLLELAESGSKLKPPPWWLPPFQSLLETLTQQLLTGQAAVARANTMEQRGDWEQAASLLRSTADSILAIPWANQLHADAARLEAKLAEYRSWLDAHTRGGLDTWKQDAALLAGNRSAWSQAMAERDYPSAAKLAESLLPRVATPWIQSELEQMLEVPNALIDLFDFANAVGLQHAGFVTTLTNRDGVPISGTVSRLHQEGIALTQADGAITTLSWDEIPAEPRMRLILRLIREEIQSPESPPRDYHRLFTAAATAADFWVLPHWAETCRSEARRWSPGIITPIR